MEGAVVLGEIAGGDVLAVAAEVDEGKGLFVDDFEETLGPAPVLDIRLARGTGGGQIERIALGDEMGEVVGHGIRPAALFVHPGVGGARAEADLLSLDRGRERDIADGNFHPTVPSFAAGGVSRLASTHSRSSFPDLAPTVVDATSPALKIIRVGNAADAVAGRRGRVFVDIDFGDGDASRQVLGQFFDQGPDLPARTAPCGPEVHQNGSIGRQDVTFEAGVGHRGYGHWFILSFLA